MVLDIHAICKNIYRIIMEAERLPSLNKIVQAQVGQRKLRTRRCYHTCQMISTKARSGQSGRNVMEVGVSGTRETD